MNRRVFLGRCTVGALGAVFAGSAAVADSFERSVVAQLRGQGYREINVERTMLGRVRIVGAKGGGTREIILNPRTGEILRDVVLAADGRVEPQITGSDDTGNGTSGSGSDDSSSDDNDSSGHGSGGGSSGEGSGGGSSGGGSGGGSSGGGSSGGGSGGGSSGGGEGDGEE